jgi:hypothetical protein
MTNKIKGEKDHFNRPYCTGVYPLKDKELFVFLMTEVQLTKEKLFALALILSKNHLLRI